MINQESYLLKLIEKTEQLEVSINNLKIQHSNQSILIQQIERLEPTLNRNLKESLSVPEKVEELVKILNQSLDEIPESIPKPIILKLEEGSYKEIVKSTILVFLLFSVFILGINWVKFHFFYPYKQAWDTVYQNNNEKTQNYLDEKLLNAKNDSFWKHITK
ncbi:hypothetical protein JM84_2710 [Dokdonia sp. Hel_I_63]|uniref:hypothetical protein n=1 Tax=Dokdonia sp. Hel_I_63 TaxID=1249996 RepID=UPI00119A9B69|nr:hypothetical protein [Dokdonia sp. Hel_I_63]TVZ23756.1 hypothetical protein JM84_2710 [Dokdonia sp. Hel_I_63]